MKNACMTTPTNRDIANLLVEIADKLTYQKANPYRVTAYRNAAQKIDKLKKKLAIIADHDHINELIAIPTIGKSIANVIIEFVNTGSSQFLNRINGYSHEENLFDEIPGVGPHLSHLISQRLKINTLEELKKANLDGRLERLPGFGPKRIQMIQMALDSMVNDKHEARIVPLNIMPHISEFTPEISVLLRLDYLYRNKAVLGELHMIKPEKFNPNKQAWLPIYHQDLEGWHFTCLYSNSANAHQKKKIKDWVIIYYEKDGVEGQCTIVTEIKGDLTGQRVIRGREQECYDFYMKKLAKEF